MKAVKEFSVCFGALCGSISKQLLSQDILFDSDDAKRWQHYSDCLTSLYINFIITESEYHKGNKRLLFRIKRDLLDIKHWQK